MTDTYRVSAEELRSFIEQIERAEAEKKDWAERQKEIYTEAASRGYDAKVMRKMIAIRKRDAQDVAEEAAILEIYQEALGGN